MFAPRTHGHPTINYATCSRRRPPLHQWQERRHASSRPQPDRPINASAAQSSNGALSPNAVCLVGPHARGQATNTADCVCKGSGQNCPKRNASRIEYARLANTRFGTRLRRFWGCMMQVRFPRCKPKSVETARLWPIAVSHVGWLQPNSVEVWSGDRPTDRPTHCTTLPPWTTRQATRITRDPDEKPPVALRPRSQPVPTCKGPGFLAHPASPRSSTISSAFGPHNNRMLCRQGCDGCRQRRRTRRPEFCALKLRAMLSAPYMLGISAEEDEDS